VPGKRPTGGSDRRRLGAFAVTATGIGFGLARSIPVVGHLLSDLFFGGAFPSLGSLPRLYTIHVVVIPLSILGLMSLHLLLVLKQKHSMPGYARKLAEPGKVLGIALWPYHALLAGQLVFLMLGALSLLLGLYGLQLLAVNYAGLALMALGIGLIVTEFFMPAFGSLGVGGLAAFVVGSIILFDNQASGMRVALPLIVGIAVAGGLVVVTIGWLADRARRRPVSTGVETMIGALVEATSDCRDQCVVRYGGELWNARSAGPLRAGQQARIVKVVGLTLWVEPQQN